MKKILYIGIAVVALGLASCSKQDIQPASNTDAEVPVWKSNTIDNETPGPTTTTGSNDGGITDPDPTEEESLEGGI